CGVRGCPCTEVELALYPRAVIDRGDSVEDLEPVAIHFDVPTRELRGLADPAGWLAAPVDEAWLRGELAGEAGDRLVSRFERLRASHDRRTWQRFAWSTRKPSEMVAHFELFPHDWDLLVQPGDRPAWIIDSYCVEPSCSCQDIVVSVQSSTGGPLGDATLRLSGRGEVRIVRCTAGALAYVERLVDTQCSALQRRYAEMRGVARRLKTWSQDLADPAATVETLLARRKELVADDLDRVHALGGRVVAQLAATVLEPGADVSRRRRAARLLAATHDPAAAAALASAVCWADPEVDPELFDEVVHVLNGIREPALAALLAVLPSAANEDERARVVFALADLRIANSRVLALVAEQVGRDPGRWIPQLRWQGEAAIPIAREALAAALAAGSERLNDALEAVDVLEELGAAIGDEARAVIARVEQGIADAEASRQARASADAEVARVELAAFDRGARPGRNQPCRCGSGEKYKQCHLAADEITRGELVRRVHDGGQRPQ
ncbi:MAG: SEC-C domain-containing protein, partial [Proteobacteria bacterium]|nr:SEC-C domain-containing protein [Pseudomonadota bacterium]